MNLTPDQPDGQMRKNDAASFDFGPDETDRLIAAGKLEVVPLFEKNMGGRRVAMELVRPSGKGQPLTSEEIESMKECGEHNSESSALFEHLLLEHTPHEILKSNGILQNQKLH